MRKNTFILLLACCTLGLNAQLKYDLIKDIPYVDNAETDKYRKERCKLDVYYPVNQKGFATVVWFHGGGLEGGEKHLPYELKEKGIAVIPVNYRLSPNAKNPAYIEDAAAAVAWVFNNIEQYGGNAENIFVSGHSAGGYLTLMVGLDKSYLEKYGIDADKIRGLIPISGQTNTHFTIRKERNLPADIPVIDNFAPINQSRKNSPPTLLISGDRELEIPARYEENLHLETILKSLGNKNVVLYELQGFNHVNVAIPGYFLLLEWIRKYGVKQD